METIGFDGGMLLLDSARQRLTVYNAMASEVWRALNAGCGAAEIAAELAAAYGEDADGTRRDVDAIIEHWRTEGLYPELPGASFKPATCSGRDDPGIPSWAAEWVCRFRDHVIGFAVEDRDRAEPIRNLFRDLEVHDAEAQSRLEIREGPAGEAILVKNGTEQARVLDPLALKSCVHQSILECIRPGVGWLALIHGGAVAKGGVGIGLPAISGSGKTTLIAYLIRHGFDYLSDDLIGLAAPDATIVPWPTPLSIKAGSWQALAPHYPELSSSPTFRVRGLRARLLAPPPAAWQAEPLPLRLLVFPKYQAAADTAFRRISALDALGQLLSAGIWLGYPLCRERVQAFLDWLIQIPAYVLAYDELGEGARCVGEMLHASISLANGHDVCPTAV
jgi:hypothetical protein